MQRMENKIERFFWHRQAAIDDAILSRFADFIAPGKVVVDVGAGYSPWPYANEFVDLDAWGALDEKHTHYVDLELDPLPFADKSVDFLYCRHTLEDMHCPLLLCREINRVAKAGYIETPSPMAEFCRGIDAGTPPYRGYVHHRWFIWMEGGTLTFLPKYIVAELLALEPHAENAIVENLNRSPVLWNTYCGWTESFPFRMLRSPADFSIRGNYGQFILAAIDASAQSTIRFVEDAGLAGKTFEGSTGEGGSEPLRLNADRPS